MLPQELNPIIKDFLNYETPSKINTILKNYNQTKFLKDINSITLDTIPGIKYSYSSAGTELTAYILETVYKSKYENLLVDFLTKKVGMGNTKIILSQEEMVKLAVGYHSDNSKVTLPMGKLPWGAGGNIKSTVPDMMKFIKYQLENNKVVQESHKPLVQYSSELGVAYFWNVNSSDKKLGIRYIHHGGVPRSQCYLFIIPKHNFGAFLITNQSGLNTAKKMNNALNEIFYRIIEPE